MARFFKPITFDSQVKTALKASRIIIDVVCLIQHDGRTPLMEVVRSNMVDMVKVLIYATDDRTVWKTKETTDVDLSLQDSDGKSVIHHCVQNRKVKALGNLVITCLVSSFGGLQSGKVTGSNLSQTTKQQGLRHASSNFASVQIAHFQKERKPGARDLLGHMRISRTFVFTFVSPKRSHK